MPSNSFESGDGVEVLSADLFSGEESLSAERCLQIHRIMVRSRLMEERMIKMSKSGQGYFWIGGPGEEAVNACLGLQVKKGQGPDFDYLHFHYRNSACMVAMGMPLIHSLRIMAMTRTDSHTMGRNFVGHFSCAEWNVIPVTSVIAVQFVIAPGTARVQKRHGGDGITIVIGGDAGTAEGDFASCMVWSTQPGQELPLLMLVTNNCWGISTPSCDVHSENNIIDRGKAFGIPGEVFDGNDPIASWHAIDRAMTYCRTERKPYMLEARVSRLHGHSSSSGAVRVQDEQDCIELFEQKLLEAGVLDAATLEALYADAHAELDAATEQVLQEEMPTAQDVELHTYAPSEVDRVYPEDYTGLPQ
jgi:2-oxoisovalerate dehydrogenase E1 component alpha subunit